MQKVRKLVTTIMIAALITAMEGTTILPLSHHVKADTNTVSQTSQAENDLTKYKKINGIGDNTVLGADFSHYQLQKNAWKKVWKNYKGIEVSNVFEYVRSQGINTISVKVAVNPTKDKEGNESYLSLENAKKTLKEAKKAGLKTNVTLLYSDDITYAGGRNYQMVGILIQQKKRHWSIQKRHQRIEGSRCSPNDDHDRK